MKKIYFIIALVLLSAGLGIEANANTVEAQKIVRGVVIDSETKEPLVGASVVVVGTTKGVATDVNGKFELSGVKAGDVTLKIEYVGYDAKEMSITLGRERAMSVNVELQPARFSWRSIASASTRIPMEEISKALCKGSSQKKMSQFNCQSS